MPRTARKKAKSGIYHIMLRGNNRQKVFQSRKDKLHFLDILLDYKEKLEFSVYAYCLMENHIHLLIRENPKDISEIIKRISGKYALWYNKKYDRIGYLFQDRFKSLNVEDETYFFNLLHYILYNPVDANLCHDIEEYEYSSAREYLSENSEITDISFAFQLRDKEEVMVFLKTPKPENEELLIPAGRLSDDDAEKIIRTELGACSFEQLNKMKHYQLVNYIPKIVQKGVSLRQISRITGIGMTRIRNLKKGEEL